MLQEYILVPGALGWCPSLKVTEILPILHDSEGGVGLSWLGGACEFESHCCLGFHPALAAPVHQISFTQQIPLWWESEGRRGGAENSLNKYMAKAPTILILIIDQMIKADEEIFLKVRGVIVHYWPAYREPAKDQYFQSRRRALLSVTLSKVIIIES